MYFLFKSLIKGDQSDFHKITCQLAEKKRRARVGYPGLAFKRMVINLSNIIPKNTLLKTGLKIFKAGKHIELTWFNIQDMTE